MSPKTNTFQSTGGYMLPWLIAVIVQSFLANFTCFVKLFEKLLHQLWLNISISFKVAVDLSEVVNRLELFSLFNCSFFTCVEREKNQLSKEVRCWYVYKVPKYTGN